MSDDEKTVNFTGSHSPQAIARLGSVIGSFRLDDVLGAGGQGIVYKAWDLAAQRSVALKMLVDGESGKHEELLNEARKVSRLSHKNIVPLLYVTPESESPFCVVMEYVPGVTLAHVIDAEAPLPESAALALISDVAEGLAHAHSQGIIHLDVKPGNILLERDTGIARLSDFGMAIHHSERWNRAGGGTRMYMSPEQVLRKSEQYDGRTDIWSLGVVLFEMLTSHKPFGADGHSTETQLFEEIVQIQPKPPSQWNPKLSAQTDAICLRCLEKDSAKRYPSVTRLLEDLNQARESLKEQDVSAIGADPEEDIVASKPPFVAVGGCLFALAVAVCTLLVMLGLVEAEDFRRFLQKLMKALF
ncbi:MAG: serine/threonine-protein kinase [Bythopirellula sp.]|nr:serine/threonine-protein kinase [Bythopirellula sp.]